MPSLKLAVASTTAWSVILGEPCSHTAMPATTQRLQRVKMYWKCDETETQTANDETYLTLVVAGVGRQGVGVG